MLGIAFLLYSVITRGLVAGLLFFLGMKALMLGLAMTVLPLVIKNIILWVAESANSALYSTLSAEGLQGSIVQLTGLAGYLAGLMQLPSVAAIILSAIAFRASLKFLKLV
jgi:hypothetical protein